MVSVSNAGYGEHEVLLRVPGKGLVLKAQEELRVEVNLCVTVDTKDLT